MPGGGGGSETQTVDTAPWGPQQKFLKRVFNRAEDLYNTDAPGYYPGQTTVPFAPEMEAGLQATTARALTGSPLSTAGYRSLYDTAQGNYLYGGQGFNEAVDAATRRIMPQIDSKFGTSGRYGSGLHKQAMGQTIGDIFAQQYGNERTNQLKAATIAPQIAQSEYDDIQRLMNVGAMRQGLAEKSIIEAMNRYAQDHPYNIENQKLGDFFKYVSGNYGGTQTAEVPTQGGGGFGDILGLGLSAAGLFSGGGFFSPTLGLNGTAFPQAAMPYLSMGGLPR